MPLFTVFTPTYNRAHTLHRVYESLQQQTFRNFEWLIVDDGSSDNTQALVKDWQSQSNFFPIRYVWQPNQHKKAAFNHGVRIAAGELFLPADADDTFSSFALERFAWHWSQISEIERVKFSGVCGLCVNEDGELIGDRFPGDWGIDSSSLEMNYRYRVAGEKWGFCRTDLLRVYPFPDHLDGHVPEGVVWMEIAKCYQIRFVNEVVRTYHQDAGNQLTNTANPASDAPGNLYWKSVVLRNELRWFWHCPAYFLIDAARWTRFRLHFNKKNVSGISYWPGGVGAGLIVLMAPMGITWWLYDLWKLRRINSQ